MSKEREAQKATAAIAAVSEQEFPTIIGKQNTLILFSAGWCPHCRAMRPVLEELAEAHPALHLYTVDADTADTLTARYRIRSLPTLILFHNGEEVDRLVGFRRRQEIETLLIASPTPV